MKKRLLFIAFFQVIWGFTQIDSLNYRTKILSVSDTLTFHNVSTNPYFFNLSNTDDQKIDKTTYHVDFQQSKLYLNKSFYKRYPQIDSLKVSYYIFPEFLTKTYQTLDTSVIVSKATEPLPITLPYAKKRRHTDPFKGLDTQGNIIRGVSVGNNQDAVLNSTLDLKIEGKLSPKVSLSAYINDTNIPLQENGYSQDPKDIDRVYMEITGPQWKIDAGDIFFRNEESYFMQFNKKVSGVGLQVHVDSLQVMASGALVRGRFVSYKFIGEEANQGPYKLKGNNDEAYIFIIAGSERVYINGFIQERGIDKDYVIDYNTAEITFNPTKPISSDMRITVEFQYSDKNYTRFITYDGLQYQGKKFKIGANYYLESDDKNSPLQLNLTKEQEALLAESGNQSEGIYLSNETEAEFDENKILYRKITNGNLTYYEYNTDPDEELYQVTFSYVGSGIGDYSVQEYLANGRIMEYAGEGNGDYIAKILVYAPSKHEILSLQSSFQPWLKSDFEVELAYSNKDVNLFSSIRDDKNPAPAVKARWNQIVIDSMKQNWRLSNHIKFDYINTKFQSIEKIYQIEFDRDWNLQSASGNQSLFTNSLQWESKNNGQMVYVLERLEFKNFYKGWRHMFHTDLNWHQFNLRTNNSLLNSEDNFLNTRFLRSNAKLSYSPEKWWAYTEFDFEKNLINDPIQNQLQKNSNQYVDLLTGVGIGDTAKVFTEVGLQFRRNDSLQNYSLEKAEEVKGIFLKSQLLKKEQADLFLFFNLRERNRLEAVTLISLNSQVSYRQHFWKGLLQTQTSYINTSGNIARQEYTYIETAPGQGYYTWNDYNENGIQELDEFEIAQYADEASFLRFALPNINYIPTQKSQWQQSLQLDFSPWQQKSGIRKILAYFSNQTQISAANEQIKESDKLHINPFDFTDENIVGLQFNLKNSLFFNRHKAHYTTAYHYIKNQNQISQTFDNMENKSETHQIQFQHRIRESWQMESFFERGQQVSLHSSFINRNYRLKSTSIKPQLSYFFGEKNKLSTSYTYAQKENQIGDLEHLAQQELSLLLQITGKKQAYFNLEFNAIKNNFSGNTQSAVGYQMLEGLQPGNNFTWVINWTQKLNNFLFLNLNYNGRGAKDTKTIHHGMVQLRASF